MEYSIDILNLDIRIEIQMPSLHSNPFIIIKKPYVLSSTSASFK